MNKKGLSEVISYTLLILIAVILSIIAFAFLKLYVPKNKPECKDGINLIIGDTMCVIAPSSAEDIFTLTLKNKGTFKVDKAYVRIGKEGRKFKYDVGSIYGENPHPLFIGTEEGLSPGNTLALNLIIPSSVDRATTQPYILEVQPAHYTKAKDINSLALCPPITQTITCALRINDLETQPKAGNKIQLTWTHVGAQNYHVYRSDDEGISYNKIAETKSTYSTYLDTDDSGSPIIAGNTYYYYLIGIFPTYEVTSNIVSETA